MARRRAERVAVENRALVPNGNPVEPPGTVGPPDVEGGDPEGFSMIVESEPTLTSTRIVPSQWAGWPDDWPTPLWGSGRLGELTDTAWAALDLNSSILSTMPAYVVADGEVVPGPEWLTNPDPDLYASWEEFAKQLFWDYQLGEAFVLPTAYEFGMPARFHVVSPWLVNVEMRGGRREYRIGSIDVTDEILHIRYQSRTDDARGHGPLEAGGARVVAAAALARYATNVARGGGVPHSAIVSQTELTSAAADRLLHQWWVSRMEHLGLPAILSGGIDIKTLQFSPRDMALLDLSQFNESRIAVLCGVPPFLLGLPSGGDSMTYSNVSSLFDYHRRAGLRPKASPVMSALSAWALPVGERLELNRDEYTRPGFAERVAAWVQLHGIGAITAEQIAAADRLIGERAPASLLGGT